MPHCVIQPRLPPRSAFTVCKQYLTEISGHPILRIMLGRLATDATALRVRSCGLPGASATLRMPYGQRAPPCGETAVPCAASAASQACEEQAALERCVRERYDYDRVVAQAPQPEAVEWIFGYGSIVFKQGFEAAHGLAGCINGWRRGFYQLSTGACGNHRRKSTALPALQRV